jgi:uncharacterized membrane protein (DUF485 family)
MLEAPHTPAEASAPAFSRRRLWLLVLLALAAFAGLLAVPMFGDPRSIYAASFISGQQPGAFLARISYPYCMRGYAYKCLFYGLYRGAELVVDSRWIAAFELVTRLMYYSGFVALAAWFFWLLRTRIAGLGLHWIEVALLFLVGVLATSHHIHQQAEELALLLTVGLTAFALSDNKLLNALSGLFLGLMFSCKIVTIWPAVFPFFLVLATRNRGRIVRVGASWACFFAATLLFCVFMVPQELVDIRNAALCQGGSWLSPRTLRAGLTHGVWALAHIPFYLVAVACLGWLLWRGLEERRWKGLLLAVAAVAIGSVPVVPQALHLCYHYLLLFPAAFLIVLGCLRLVPDAGRRSRMLCAMATATFAGWLLFSSTDVNADAYAWLWMKAAWQQNAALQEMERRFQLSEESEMLFLAPGDANYVLRTRPCSRYYAPVILQRANWNASLRKTPLFRDMLAPALAYHGKYIYLSDWLPLDHLPELEVKLKTEYEPATEKIEQFYPIPDVQLFRRRVSPRESRAALPEAAASPR